MKKNVKGYALVTTLIVLAVVAILGGIILQTSLAESKFVIHDEKRMQAYYLAKSGVEATAAWMINPDNNGVSIVDRTSAAANIGTGSCITKVTRKTLNLVLVEGEGNVSGVKNSATLTLIDRGTGSPLFTEAIYGLNYVKVGGNMTMPNGGIIATGAATVVTEGSNVSAFIKNGGVIKSPPLYPPTFPSEPTSANPDINYIGGGDHGTLTGNLLVYDSFYMENGKVKFNTGSDPNGIMKVVINDLNLLSGSVEIVGNGKLYLYVNKITTLKADINKAGDSGKLFLFLNSGSNLVFEGDRCFYGFIYGPEAIINLSGCGDFRGAVIGYSVTAIGDIKLRFIDTASSITSEALKIQRFFKGQWLKQ